jgi:hypothetical protein
MDFSSAIAVASSLLPMIPVAAAWIVALALAVRRWERHRSVSAWTVTGISILFVTGVAGRAVSVLLPLSAMRAGRSYSEMGLVLTGVAMVTSVVSAGAWAFIIAAIFGERGRS